VPTPGKAGTGGIQISLSGADMNCHGRSSQKATLPVIKAA
jgi:hypothetical protein